MAAKAGYKNIKIYTAGIPAWKKAKQLVVVKNSWLAKNLDIHHVIVDVRPTQQSRPSGIKTSLSFETAQLETMSQQFKQKKVKSSHKNLPNLVDKKAPIILYSEKTDSADVVKAYQTLRSWKYKNVTILDGGFKEWTHKQLPVQNNVRLTKINFVKKLVKGAISPENFKQFHDSNEGLVLDVRTKKEAKAGKLNGSMNVPLDTLEANLASVPKNKEVAIHCVSGTRANIAYNLLKSKGYQKVRFLNNNITIDKDGDYKID
ncbi:MAG: hypothetical protein HQM14_03200 [SAR324 cluster bacterium]|nr:hypothetical protein [SAR324 cluster bacterium]